MKKLLEMRIALFTSNHLRHKYVSAQIGASVNLELIITEAKNSAIENTADYSKEDQLLLNAHFTDRQISEKEYFEVYNSFPHDVKVVEKEYGTLNSDKTLDLLQQHKIDCILLFGTSIIKPVILDVYPGKVINLHLGLSPYYKGSGTNFFPIVNSEFECLGATIHLATSKVDAGAILHQLRLENLTEADTIHSLGNKLIRDAGAVFPKVVLAYLNDKISGIPQIDLENSKVFRIKDFTPEALRTAHKVLSQGGIAKYLKEASARIRSKPIITNYDG
jgi:methionyl-tRNA formyltransferase